MRAHNYLIRATLPGEARSRAQWVSERSGDSEGLDGRTAPRCCARCKTSYNCGNRECRCHERGSK